MLTPILREIAQAVGEVDPAAGDVLAKSGHIVHLASNWRGRAVYLAFEAKIHSPAVVLKVDKHPRYQPRLNDEYARLQAIGGIKALDGTVPRPLALLDIGPRRVLAQSGIDGTSLHVLQRRRLRHGPRTATRDHALVADWLDRLHDGSPESAPVRFDPEHLHTTLRSVLAADTRDWRPLLTRIEQRAAELEGLSVPQVWCHGDLGPGNCFKRGRSLGVIDWEGAITATSPLVDLVIFLNHYARLTFDSDRQFVSPQEAFVRAFIGHDWLARVTDRTLRTGMVTHGLPADAAPYFLLSTITDMATDSEDYVHAAMFREQYRDAAIAYATHLASDLSRL